MFRWDHVFILLCMQTVIIIIIPYVTFNLNLFHLPPYEREVLHYKLANSDCIQRTIKNFYWEKAFINVDVNKKVLLFNETITKDYSEFHSLRNNNT